MRIGKTAIIIAAIPAVVAAYIAIAGTTGFCPTCTGIMDSVLGRQTASAGQPETIKGLTATDLDGKTVALDSFVGKPVILDFWATWCAPCNAQRGVFADMENELRDKVQIVALSVDSAGPSVVKEHIARTGHAAEHEFMATNSLAQSFGVSVIPTLVFVDAAGNVRKAVTGTQSADALRREIAALQ